MTDLLARVAALTGNDEATQLARELAAIVKRLPVDAEGNPILPGDVLWWTPYGQPSKSGPAKMVVRVADPDASYGSSSSEKFMNPIGMHRTREAAEAAREASDV